jgi:hypothetical protein
VVDLIKQNYADRFQSNLPIYHLEFSNLKKFCTDEKQAKRGITMMPPSQFRNYDEDLIKEDAQFQSFYTADSQKIIRDNISFINKKGDEGGLETVDKERDRKLDSDEEDLMNGGADDDGSTQLDS